MHIYQKFAMWNPPQLISGRLTELRNGPECTSSGGMGSLQVFPFVGRTRARPRAHGTRESTYPLAHELGDDDGSFVGF